MSEQNFILKRVTIRPKQPNPLFEKWLQEWKEEAAARGSDMQYCFSKALESLKKYPLPLHSGRECGILQNFGNRLCVMLDRKLAEYNQQNPNCIPNKVSSSNLCSSSPENTVQVSVISDQQNIVLDNIIDLIDRDQKNKSVRTEPKEKVREESFSSKEKKKKSNDYSPAYRSGPYAILLALLSCSQKEGNPGFVTKTDLIKVAQPLCDASFSKAEHGSFYTAWSSMASLLKKGLVSTTGRGKYALTESGKQLAFKLKHVGEDQEEPVVSHTLESNEVEILEIPPVAPCSSLTFKEAPTRRQGKKTSETDDSFLILLPGSFEVILLIDTHELSGTSGTVQSSDSPLNDLHKQNIASEIRHLNVGDFVWICRDKVSGRELMLPYIVERKRVDDFARSIMDGRYHEQKFRLKRCGIPNLIYLVEKHGKESHTVLPLSTLYQAATNTQVIDGFTVKYTNNHKESALYLAYFTQFLNSVFVSKTLVMCKKDNLPQFCVNSDTISLMSFKEFNSSSVKNKKLCVREMFVKQLVQLNGMSVDKALAIVERYPTPRILHLALKNDPDKKLLADIPYGTSKRRIGPVISKSIHELYISNVLR